MVVVVVAQAVVVEPRVEGRAESAGSPAEGREAAAASAIGVAVVELLIVVVVRS